MRRPALVALLALSLLGGGCSDGGEGRRPADGGYPARGGSADVTAVLDHPPAALVALVEGLPDVLASAARLRRRTYAGLDRKLEQPGPDAANGGGVHPAAFVPGALATGSGEPAVPGVQIPISEHHTKTSHDADGVQTTTSDAAIADQVLTTSISATGTVGDPAHPKAGTTTEVSSRVRMCQPAEATGVEVTTRLVMSADGAEVEVESTGTYVQGADGRVDVTRVDVVVTKTSASGAAPTVERAWATAADWDPDDHSSVLDDSTFHYTPSAHGLTEDQWATVVISAGALATGAVKSALDEARDRTETGGLCVVLHASADRSTLFPGESADIDVEVVDARTGEPVEGATVTGSGWGGGGEVTPKSVQAPGTLTFRAVKMPDYSALLSATSPRGGDLRIIRFDGPGWRFEGVSYDATAPGNPGSIPVTTTWSGRVCGDPFTDAWRVEVTFSSPVASHTIALEDVATRADQPPAGVGARLLIAEQPPTMDGGPSFRLWVDDENPAIRPPHHRVEVTNLEPIPGACTS